MEPIDLLDPLEVDRQRIGAEIHDELLPYLFAAAAKISALRRSSSELNESLAEIADWVDRSRTVARDLISSVSATDEVVDDPLAAAKSFLQSIRVDRIRDDRDLGPSIEWGWRDHSPLKGQLNADVAAAAYRIVCESVRNSLRHANAEKITVSCRAEHSATKTSVFLISVCDDGCGMDSTIDTTKNQSGLAWMKMRASGSQIDLQIESKPGQGTSVLLEVPVGEHSQR